MPYIADPRRHDADMAVLEQTLDNTIARKCTPGDLNYILTVAVRAYMRSKGHTYTHMADCLAALEGAKLEFYRRVVVPLEVQKMLENGDVY